MRTVLIILIAGSVARLLVPIIYDKIEDFCKKKEKKKHKKKKKK